MSSFVFFSIGIQCLPGPGFRSTSFGHSSSWSLDFTFFREENFVKWKRGKDRFTIRTKHYQVSTIDVVKVKVGQMKEYQRRLVNTGSV